MDAILASGQIDQPNLEKNSFFYQQAKSFNLSLEILDLILDPMVKTGQEATGSMGTDTPLAVLSDRPQLLYNYFKQLFAQVTNPPLDGIREEIVTDTSLSIGNEFNLFDNQEEWYPSTLWKDWSCGATDHV